MNQPNSMTTNYIKTLVTSHDEITSSRGIDLYSKLHARAIHERGNTPELERPNISKNVPNNAYNLAWNAIISALNYLSAEEIDEHYDGSIDSLDDYAKESLERGAAHLEKLFLDQSPTPRRTQELYTTALAYYLAGFAPRAFVIMKGVSSDHDHDYSLLFKSFLLRDIRGIRTAALQRLKLREFEDIAVATTLQQGITNATDAIQEALHHIISRIYLSVIEFARTGNTLIIDKALELAQLGQVIAIGTGLHEWWWHFHCSRLLIAEYKKTSLWSCLEQLREDDKTGLVQVYIRSCFTRFSTPVIELWQSQRYALNYLLDGQSYCLKMPTSSGKTRVAELAILQFLIEHADDPSKKCLYVAPFRALASEIENSLSQSLKPTGAGVSQLYGSYDLNPTERLFAEQSRILIGTPEKLDAFLRYVPEMADQIALIIIDEGHIIDEGDRGLRYEFFIHRIVRRYRLRGVRLLFISAVMPNLDQFSSWITGRDKTTGAIESSWRASQQMLGILSWDGKFGRLDYLYRNQEQLSRDFFVPYYFSGLNPSELKNVRISGKTLKAFPNKNKKGQVVACTALKAVQEGTTLVYAPKPKWVESIAQQLLILLDITQQLNLSYNRYDPLVPINRNSIDSARKFDECLRYAIEVTGDEKESLLVRALKMGVIIHHGGIPRKLRTKLEELVRDGIIQLVVATNTLAQGVNLPFKTVLLHSLTQGQDEHLSVRDFWNLCGRAGRANVETEGSIFLIADNTKKQKYQTTNQTVETDKAKRAINNYVLKSQTDKVTSSILQFLQNVLKQWSEKHYSSLDEHGMSELCQLFVEGSPTWLSITQQRQLRIVDAQLLALIEELEIADPDRDKVADLFSQSLLHLQTLSPSATRNDLTYETTISLIISRIDYVMQICNTSGKRKRFYRMGISLSDCQEIESMRHDLQHYLSLASNYMMWTAEERAEYVVTLCANYLMKLKDIKEDSRRGTEVDLPECWAHILRLWLLGETPQKIKFNLEETLTDGWNDVLKISSLIDELCEYRLPWGLNAVSMYFTPMDNDPEGFDQAFQIPESIKYFASILRFGVHCPIASVMLACGAENRQACLTITKLYIGELTPESIVVWLYTITPNLIESATDDQILQEALLSFIVRFHDTARQHAEEPLKDEVIEAELLNPLNQPLEHGTHLIALAEDENISLFEEISFIYIGDIRIGSPSLKKRICGEDVVLQLDQIHLSAKGNRIWIRTFSNRNNTIEF